MKAVLLSALFFGLSLTLGWGAPMTNLEITSGEFTEGGRIPKRFTCDGLNDNPSIRIAGPPERTQSLALMVDDEDAPAGTFTHWLVWNIPPETKEFIIGTTPNGVVQGINDFGKSGYSGPCPPSGEHRYVFHLYALDKNPQLTPQARRREFDAALKGHILGEAKLTGRYSREVVGK
jgi:hypothetical protein